jgi:hypothetical protein
MTEQDVFDAVNEHMEKQGRPSCIQLRPEDQYDIDGLTVSAIPRLRGPGGLRSPIGSLLTDDEYTESLEARWPAPGDLPSRLRAHFHLIKDLELAHDEGFMRGGIHSWRRLMDSIATEYKLRYEAPR